MVVPDAARAASARPAAPVSASDAATNASARSPFVLVPSSFDKLLRSVVRRFLRDRDVVHVAFAHAGRSDPHQLRVALKRRDVRRSAIAHAGAQAADELMNHRGDRALVLHAALDPLRHQLVAAAGVEIELVLEVAVAAAAAHRADRAHPAILLEAAALVDDHLARALVGAGEEVADHGAAGADGDGFRDVAGEPDAA